MADTQRRCSRSCGDPRGTSCLSPRPRRAQPRLQCSARLADARSRLSCLAISPKTSGSTPVGPPELSVPERQLGVADSGGSYDAVGHPELVQASAIYRAPEAGIGTYIQA